MSDAQERMPAQAAINLFEWLARDEAEWPPVFQSPGLLKTLLQAASGVALIVDRDAQVLAVTNQEAQALWGLLETVQALPLRRALGSLFPSRYTWEVSEETLAVRCVPLVTEQAVYYCVYAQKCPSSQRGERLLEQFDQAIQCYFFEPHVLEYLFLRCLQRIPSPYPTVDHIWFFHFLPQFKPLYAAFFDSRQAEVTAFHQMLEQGQVDWRHLERVGHRLKGSGGSYGFPLLSVLGAAIEQFAQQGQQEALVIIYAYVALYLGQVQPRVEACLSACSAQDNTASAEDASPR